MLPGGAEGARITATHCLVSPSYFGTLGVPLLEGRTFAEDLGPDGPAQIVVMRSTPEALDPSVA